MPSWTTAELMQDGLLQHSPESLKLAEEAMARQLDQIRSDPSLPARRLAALRQDAQRLRERLLPMRWYANQDRRLGEHFWLKSSRGFLSENCQTD